MIDINFPMLLLQLLNISVLIGWIVLIVRALRRLSITPMSEGERLGWAVLILFIPILGALAFLITHQQHEQNAQSR